MGAITSREATANSFNSINVRKGKIMVKFTRYLDAWGFCTKHNLSMTAINKTGYSEYTVFVDDKYVVAQSC